MDHTTLVEADIRDGEIVLDALRQDEIQIGLVFWAKLSIYDGWKLFVMSPTFDGEPLLQGYVRTALALDGKFSFSKPPYIVLSSDDVFAEAVREEVRRWRWGGAVRIQEKQVGNRYVEDCYVYPVGEFIQ